MAHGRPLRLEDFLPYRLSLLSNSISSRIARDYEAKFGISMPEWRIMMILAEYPGISGDEVCRRTRIEKSVVSRATARLLKRRLVTRSMNSQDRRRQVLALSETGKSVYDEVMPHARDFERRLLKNLSASDAKAFDQLLSRLQREVDELP